MGNAKAQRRKGKGWDEDVCAARRGLARIAPRIPNMPQ